ncbi:Pollen Ole e 1 allergen and extensin family protein [Perilla frutescens var. hirtella]|nr:Pollen Ole e 1 allergen and extensin family protein [Perilla frutescens var. hirtella]
MSWFWTLIFLTFTLSEAKHHPNKLPSAAAAIVGTVYCDTCFHQDFPKSNNFIAGATVAVECKKSGSSTPYFRQEAKTNSRGDFRVELPFSVSKHVRNIRACSVALIRSDDPFCAAAAAATSSSLRLKSRSQGKRIFSAGFFTFKPQVCDQKHGTDTFKNGGADGKLATKMGFFLPPNPLLPPPALIPPVIPTPPPSIFPPIFPTPPPSVIPPILPTPPSSPPPFLPLLPPVPGLIPSPPPPPPPTFPVPLPPLPFLPPPLVPGGPPAKVSSQTRTSHP